MSSFKSYIMDLLRDGYENIAKATTKRKHPLWSENDIQEFIDSMYVRIQILGRK